MVDIERRLRVWNLAEIKGWNDYTLTCVSTTGCGEVIHLKIDPLRPHAGPIALFCPHCGAPKPAVEPKLFRSYWAALAEGLGLQTNPESEQLIQLLYEQWRPNEYMNFRDYAANELHELRLLGNPDGG